MHFHRGCSVEKFGYYYGLEDKGVSEKKNEIRMEVLWISRK